MEAIYCWFFAEFDSAQYFCSLKPSLLRFLPLSFHIFCNRNGARCVTSSVEGPQDLSIPQKCNQIQAVHHQLTVQAFLRHLYFYKLSKRRKYTFKVCKMELKQICHKATCISLRINFREGLQSYNNHSALLFHQAYRKEAVKEHQENEQCRA